MAAGGERTCSIAMTEPEAGSDAAGIRTTATPDGGGAGASTATSVTSATAHSPISSWSPRADGTRGARARSDGHAFQALPVFGERTKDRP